MAATALGRVEDQCTLGPFRDGGRSRRTPWGKRELPGGIRPLRYQACKADFAYPTLVIKDLPSSGGPASTVGCPSIHDLLLL
jgi:hypothetical protein